MKPLRCFSTSKSRRFFDLHEQPQSTFGPRAVCGVYKSQREIDWAVAKLKRDNFRTSAISIVAPGDGGLEDSKLSSSNATIVCGSFKSVLASVVSRRPLPTASEGLIALGISEHETHRYEDRLKEGRFLVSIRAENSDSAEAVIKILKHTGAEDITATNDENFNNEIIH